MAHTSGSRSQRAQSVSEMQPFQELKPPTVEPFAITRRARLSQLFRYLMVGGFNTLFGYSLFAALNYWLTGHIPYPYMVANVLANILAITFSFIGYKYFVFKTKGNLLREYLRTYLVYGSSTLLGLALLPMLMFALGYVIHQPSIVPYVAQGIGTVFVVTASFFGHKKYSFRA